MPLSDLYSFPDRLSVLHVTHTQVFAEADFLELDATYHAATEMKHLINAVTTMHCKLNIQVMFIISREQCSGI